MVEGLIAKATTAEEKSVYETDSGGRLGVPLTCVGCPSVDSLKKYSVPDILAHLL
jgi:hypothetical protein